MEKTDYTNSKTILNRVEWACSSNVFLYLIIFCVIAAFSLILTSTLKTKVKRKKDIAFRAGYAKALHMDKLPKELF